MNSQLMQDMQRIYPELAVTVALLAVIVFDLAFPRIRKSLNLLTAAAGLIAGIWFLLPLCGMPDSTIFYGMVAIDPMALFFKGFFLVTSFLVLLIANGSPEIDRDRMGEFQTMLLGVTLAMMLLASSTDMLMLFLSLEMLSVGSYIMVGFLRNSRQSNEASLKYFLFGAVSTGCMLYGITLLFGLAGSAKFAAVREVLVKSAATGENSLMLLVASVLIIAGFGFKTAAVPFHFWCPDVYTGAPTPVTAFLSVGPKAAGFAALVRFFFTGLSSSSGSPVRWSALTTMNWPLLLLMLSLLTMTLGNIAALRQDNLKRLLAYSSIAHAGYILMGAVVVTTEGLQSIVIYLITYLFMNLGAFLVVIEVFNRTGSFDIKAYSGLVRRSPFLAIAMSIFMLSLMGIPPFAGFFGKLFVFAAAVRRDLAWFAVVGALNSVIAVYYYVRVIKTMIIDSAETESKIEVPLASQVLVWAMLLPTVGLMLMWDRVQKLAVDSVRIFTGI
jgi:NADH-quinone oxidoreductase subunit N